MSGGRVEVGQRATVEQTKARLRLAGELVTIDAVTAAFLANLKSRACRIRWLEVYNSTTNICPDAAGLLQLFKALKVNKSVTMLDVKRIFNAYEFMDEKKKEAVLKAMVQLFVTAPYIVGWAFTGNILSSKEVQLLVDALNDPKVQQDPRIRLLQFDHGDFDGVKGVISLIKTQLHNPTLRSMSFRGSIPIDQLLHENVPTADAAELMKLFNDSRLAGKLTFDAGTTHVLQRLQARHAIEFATPVSSVYHERKTELSTPVKTPSKLARNRYEMMAGIKKDSVKLAQELKDDPIMNGTAQVKVTLPPAGFKPNRRYG